MFSREATASYCHATSGAGKPARNWALRDRQETTDGPIDGETTHNGSVISQMPWAELLSSVVAPFVAVIATLVGLVVALSQFTAAARLRKQAEFWKQEYLDADLAHDKRVYQSMHRLAVGKIIARNGVPLRRIAFAACLLIPGALLPVTSTQHLVFHPGTEGLVLFALGVLAGVVMIFIAIGEYSVLNYARRGVLDSFLDGDRIISNYDVWPDRRRAFEVLGLRGVLEVFIVSVSACAVVVATTASVAALLNKDAVVPDWVEYVANLAYPSVLYLLFAFAASSNFKRSEILVHPRRLTETAEIAAKIRRGRNTRKSL